MISHRTRIEACLAGEKTDRVPVALWRHFPIDDQTPGGLAKAVLSFQKTFDFDLVKVTPESSYCLKDWGAQDEWRGDSEGTRDYTHHVIQYPEDWERLPVLDPHSGHLGNQLECLRLIVKDLGPETPVIQTIFNPLSQAKNLVGGQQLLVHLRRYPQAVRAGLKTITASTLAFIEAAHQTGIAGIFYAVQHAQYGLLSADEYSSFQRDLDLELLNAAGDLPIRMMHLHGEEVMFTQLADYPVNIINWHDRETYPSLAEGQKLFPGVVCGGLEREKTMLLGSPEEVRLQALDAIGATGGQRFILGTGCVIPITTPFGNIMAARHSVDQA